MIGKLSNARVRPAAHGATLNSSVYGQVIPPYYGRTRGALYQIWANNYRKGSSGKKGKKAGKKGAPPTYIENVDFLIGANPIVSPLQFWGNENDEYPLDFAEYTVNTGGTMDPITIPDADFYCILAVTCDEAYSFTVDDYGSEGPVTYSGTWEHPLWNRRFAGPDFARNAGAENYPWVYDWDPGSGPTITFVVASGTGIGNNNFHIYYAKLRNGKVPTSQLRLTFEPQLGDGPEYSGFESQQIIYPHYAGLGSPSFDLGAGAMPNMRAEILGAFPLYKDGDCDFADIIEDIFKSGISQTGFGASQAYSPVQRGLNCYSLPANVQRDYRTSNFGVGSLKMSLPVTEGNFVVVFASGLFAGSGQTCTDTAGTVYTNIWEGNLSSGFSARAAIFVGQVLANTPDNVISVAGAGSNGAALAAWEIAGVDELDGYNATLQSGSETIGSVDSTTEPGRDAYLFSISAYGSTFPTTIPTESENRWNPLNTGWYFQAQDRRIKYPGSYSIKLPFGTHVNVTLAFKNSQPVSFPKTHGNILDQDSMQLVRNQCRAYGLWGSLCMDSQKKAAEWLDDLYQAALAAPVWSGFRLKSVPYCEVSGAGNGAKYTSPTSDGPAFDLTPDDMLADSSGQCVTIEHSAPQIDDPNILQMQYPNRGSKYNDVTISEPVAATIAQYGPRKESPKNIRCIQDTAVARKVLSVRARRLNMLGDKFKFIAQAKHKLIEGMDFGTISDPVTGLDRVPVRLTSVEEDEKFNLRCEAEPFYYGLHLPGDLAVTTAEPYDPGAANSEPPSVNDPVIFEAVDRMNSGKPGNFLWFGLSGDGDNWGGCNIYASSDGVSYDLVGTQFGETPMGLLTALFAGSGDPDTTGDLEVDVSESRSELPSFSVLNEDNFVSLCYVEGGSAEIPYELISYALADLIGPGQYAIRGTSGNKIRRGVYGTPISAHAIGKKFALLINVTKLLIDPTWLGKTVYFKFPSFNSFLSQEQSLSDCTAYPFFIPIIPANSAFGEQPSGTIDGSNTAFSLSYPPSPPFSLQLFRNGAVLRQGVDYTLSGSAIALTVPPVGGATPDWLYACYRTDGNTSSYDDAITPTGAIDGANTAFTLPHAPNPTDFVFAYRNGALLIQGVDYSISGTTLTMTVAPEAGSDPDWLIVWFRRDGVSTGSANAEIPSGAINGSNTAYVLANTPSPASSLMLFRNKILMLPGTDYVAFGTAITTTVAPQTGDSLVAFYRD